MIDVFEMRRRVTEPELSTLVEAFYDRVRDHPTLAPVFAARIPTDAWPTHLAKMKRFWATVLLGTGTYRGNPMTAHESIPDVSRAHFAQWLTLFESVVRGLFATDVATAILQRAHRMGDSLMANLGLAD